jgi:hypothetical protein
VARVHHGVIDIIALYGEHDADATRIPDNEVDILFPHTILWRTTGPASQQSRPVGCQKLAGSTDLRQAAAGSYSLIKPHW